MCDRWRNSFHAFAQDIPPRSSNKHHLHLKENDGGYHPERTHTNKDIDGLRAPKMILQHRIRRSPHHPVQPEIVHWKLKRQILAVPWCELLERSHKLTPRT
jgi:hypothetical protein